MKFVPRVQEIEAMPYVPGLEDGFMCTKVGCSLVNLECDTCSWNTRTPFINTATGIVEVDVNDWILALESGKLVISANEFHQVFRVVQ